MEVKPRIGFENIKFGMLREDIINILGEPDRILADDYEEGEQRLEWNYLKLRLTFQEDDRFTYFMCSNPLLKFKGQVFIDKKIDVVKTEIFGELKSDWEAEDYQISQTHFDEKFWLTLHSEYGRVNEFELGVPFKNETEYDWPN